MIARKPLTRSAGAFASTRTKLMLACLTAGLSVAYASSVIADEEQEEGAAQSHEGSPQTRDAYFAMRRANPYDPNFSSAMARLDAYNTMVREQNQMSASLPNSMIHL